MQTDYKTMVAAERQLRLDNLTAPESWLAVVGLDWLEQGAQRIGRGAGNDIVFPAGPDHLGILELAEDKSVRLTVAVGVEATANNEPIDGPLVIFDAQLGEGVVTIRSGTLSFGAMERGGRMALRVRDSAASSRTGFAGIEYFDVAEGWNKVGTWTELDAPRRIEVTNVLGMVDSVEATHSAAFSHQGETYTLFPLGGSAERPMFVFRDETTGSSSYLNGRFVFGKVDGDQIGLDFNLAICPPCAFTKFATCLVAPRENTLPLKVEAGERVPK